MAQQDAGGAGAEAPAPAKQEVQQAQKLSEFLQRYVPSERPPERDVLHERYRIDLGTPLPEFDSSLARAFAARDMNDPGRRLVAQVCQRGSVQRTQALEKLRLINHKYIMPLAGAGPVELSQPEEERFVIMFEQPAGRRLSDLLSQLTSPLGHQVLVNRIIAPLAAAINQFAQLGIAHGCVNPDTIYFDEVATLIPCLSEPCGLSQVFYCEPLERMQALPAGKGEGTAAQDYYALAAVTLVAMFGRNHFARYNQETLIRAILREGVYAAMTLLRDVPDAFNDYFRGMLHYHTKDRWDYGHLKPWLEGKRYNVLMPPSPAEATRAYEFGGNQAFTKRELAHLLATDWDNIAQEAQSGRLTQWASASLRNKELGESMSRIGRFIGTLSGKNEMQLVEQLTMLIMLLDPEGPLRLKHLAFHVDGMDSICASLYAAKANLDLQILAKCIEFNIANYWIDLQRREAGYQVPPALNAIMVRLDRLRGCIRNPGLGFGLERMLYDLNPGLPCLSPHLEAYHVTTLPMLLKRLDKIAPRLAKGEDPIDRHIAAFIASRLVINQDIQLTELAANPGLATHRAFMATHLLSLAQYKCGNIQLPGLTHWLALRLMPALEVIHSRSRRQLLRKMLMERAATGYVQLLAEVMVNTDFASADRHGFHMAWARYHANEVSIDKYRKGVNIDQRSLRLSLNLARVCAYLALAGSFINLVRGM